jgi:(p)ppGpp synthase/HD superfamily hydrolase
MYTDEFRQLMGTINLQEPTQVQLWRILEAELVPLSLTHKEQKKTRNAFNISFEGHKNAPQRASGEAYIFHPVRAAIRAIRRQHLLRIKDVQLIVDILLHDCYEDAEKAGISPLIMRSKVQFRMGSEVAIDVHCLTKQKHKNETNHEAFVRLITAGRWRPLAAKLEDRNDNIITIESMPQANQIAKIAETEAWLPLISQELENLLEEEVATGELGRGFLLLPRLICEELIVAIQREKDRIG